jgi:hypothetical protein
VHRQLDQAVEMLTPSSAGNQYLTGLTLYFIGYVLFEVSKPCTTRSKP